MNSSQLLSFHNNKAQILNVYYNIFLSYLFGKWGKVNPSAIGQMEDAEDNKRHPYRKWRRHKLVSKKCMFKMFSLLLCTFQSLLEIIPKLNLN